MMATIRRTTPAALVLSLVLGAVSSCNSHTTVPTGPGAAVELNSGDFGSGATYRHRFTAAGTYAYHCIHHAAMTGNVQVNASAADTLVNVNITSSSAPFPSASVKPGGTVVWMNNTGMLHTVTSN